MDLSFSSEAQHTFWKQQIQTLIASKQTLSQTDPNNILKLFFMNAVDAEFNYEIELFRSKLKQILQKAVEMAETLQNISIRERAAMVLKSFSGAGESMLANIKLNDLRNCIVFHIYKTCNCTTDTYFERYSSPPGTQQQNISYASIAHGNAASHAEWTTRVVSQAEWTNRIRNKVFEMQILKRFFTVYDIYSGTAGQVTPMTLNWIGLMWKAHVEATNLGDLVWNVFLDIWTYDNI